MRCLRYFAKAKRCRKVATNTRPAVQNTVNQLKGKSHVSDDENRSTIGILGETRNSQPMEAAQEAAGTFTRSTETAPVPVYAFFSFRCAVCHSSPLLCWKTSCKSLSSVSSLTKIKRATIGFTSSRTARRINRLKRIVPNIPQFCDIGLSPGLLTLSFNTLNQTLCSRTFSTTKSV